MNATTHQTGTLTSGDVTIFYRHFGAPGATPVVVFHGANYYDSADWIDVATALSDDREIVVRDTRGFGKSGWSPSKNYTPDAQCADTVALLDHLGWEKAVIMGHSMGGGHAVVFASRFPKRTAGLVIIDHCPGRGGGAARTGPSIDNKPQVFSTVEAAQAAMSRQTDTPEGSPARARLEEILEPVDGGFVFASRDPDFGNQVPVGIDGWTPEIVITDTWEELANVACPTMIIRGTRSDRYTDESLQRVANDYPLISLIHVDSGHDVPGEAPDALIRGVKPFLVGAVDAQPMLTS